MRKLVVLSFVSMDGVMQAPGGPEEDTAGTFKLGGWTVPYFDEWLGSVMVSQMSRSFDLLLGRKTYEIFAAHWPNVKSEDPITIGLNISKKYVASRTLTKLGWKNSELVKGEVPGEVKKLKEQDGPEIHVHGSCDLIQTLLQHDLVDELWLKIFPVILGGGKRLLAGGAIPAAFKLDRTEVSPKSVIVASYSRAGPVKTGSFAPDSPSADELESRAKK